MNDKGSRYQVWWKCGGADETGLFFKCLPDHSRCFKDEKCHGGKNSKDRVTILLTANMDGSKKLKSLMMGKSAKPRCLKDIKSFPKNYRSNKADLFNEWLKLLDGDMERQLQKILLFVLIRIFPYLTINNS